MRLQRKQGFYEKYIKRLLDIVSSLLFIIVFSWLYLIIAIIVRIKMGSPVIFKQPRPGIVKNGKETIFNMFKFRSMTDERGPDGELLPDEKRLPAFGAFLRSTSLDELPEVFCILRGTMSVAWFKNGFRSIYMNVRSLVHISFCLSILFIWDYISLKRDIILTVTSCKVPMLRLVFYIGLISLVLLFRTISNAEFVYFQF